MSQFTVITNTIRRPLEMVEKSVRFSLMQNNLEEVILVDQNPVPTIFSDDIRNNSKFKQIHANVPSISMARNRAPYSSNAEWLIFCDDDGYLDKNYTDHLLKAISNHPDVEIFAGAIRRIDNQEFYSRRQAMGGDMKWFLNAKLMMGSNFVIKRSLFEKLGKFDEQFGIGGPLGSSEETDLAWNAFFHHHRMHYSPELVVFHVPPYGTDVRTEIKKAYRYGIGKGALVRKWLARGHLVVVLELLEMILFPLAKALVFLLLLRGKSSLIQLGTFGGRMAGLVTQGKSV